MIRVQPPTRQTDRIGFPWDLTDWIDSDTLLAWIQEEVAALDWRNPLLDQYLQAHPEFRPQMLLTLLLYAYATGVYASEDVAEQCYSNAVCRSICGSEAPASRDIEVFRRENQGLLKRELQEVLKRSLQKRFDLGEGLLPPGLRPHLEQAALTRLDLARHLDRAARAA